ncbi:MAG: clostripain-related cysteine peptidase [Lachnospiraceae bacterium]|nr:clostripain-related cysteine peptidase [Lachnospiraceae bacterium]
MDRNNIPKGREKNVTGGTGSVHRRGEGLGTGPVGNGGGYSGRPGTGGGSGMGRPASQGGGFGNIGNMLNGNTLRGGSGKGGCGGGCLFGIVAIVLVIIFAVFVFSRCTRLFTGGLLDGGDYQNTEVYTVPPTTVAHTTVAPTTAAPVQPHTTAAVSDQGQSYGNPNLYATSNNNGILNEEVADGARNKYTEFGDDATVMVYMCGTDLESSNGMGTADIQEMLKSGLGNNINLILYTGGCSKWQNNVISSSTNQIYRVTKDGLERLVDKDGNKSMSDPATLTSFIKYAAKNYPSERYILILWDHGAGSVNGYAYDEKHPSSGYMSLSGIDEALNDADVKFDFIGFDACLMATLENGLMLSKYADYMIASEETEPGTGWYYTNWLKALSKDPKISTVRLGKQIADDFSDASRSYSRGSDTTLSVTDLAELKATVPVLFKVFASATAGLLESENFTVVSTARGNTKEFARSEKLDQIDLVNFAQNLGTVEGSELGKAIQSAVKYNRTSSGYDKAYGLSVFFPYRKMSYVDVMVKTYEQIGMETEYTRCIKKFANLELAGQISTGGTGSEYGSLFDSLFGDYGGYSSQGSGGYTFDWSDFGYGSSHGGGNSYQGSYGGQGSHGGSSYSGGYGSLTDYYGSGYGSSGSMSTELISSMLEMFLGGRSNVSGISSTEKFIDAETIKNAAGYIAKNSINTSHLSWTDAGGRTVLAFDDNDWENTQTLLLNAFYDDGEGFIDLGLDNIYDFDEDGNLSGEFDNTWLAVNGQPVAYYFADEADSDEGYVIRGYIPAFVNNRRCEIFVTFTDENPDGSVVGYKYVYRDEGNGQVAKLAALEEGDVIDFIADYYAYDGSYLDSYKINEQMTYDGTFNISNIRMDRPLNATYRIEDIYGQFYWTKLIPNN